MNYYICITEISIIFCRNHLSVAIRVATAVSDKNNGQHIRKFGMAHSCYEILHPRFISPRQVNFDQGSIFFVSLPKLSQSTQYFVCCLHSHYLRINRNHSSLKDTQFYNTMVYTPPGSTLTHVVLIRVNASRCCFPINMPTIIASFSLCYICMSFILYICKRTEFPH